MSRSRSTVLSLVRLATLSAVIGLGSGIGGCAGRNVAGPFEGAGWNNLLGTGDSVRNIRDNFLKDLNKRKIAVNRPDVVESLRALNTAIKEVESPRANPTRVRDALLAFCKAAIPIVVGGDIEGCTKQFQLQLRMCSGDRACIDRVLREYDQCVNQPMEKTAVKNFEEALTRGQREPRARGTGVEAGEQKQAGN